MNVTVTTADLETVHGEGTVTMLCGTDEDGARVVFAGDTRMVADLVAGVLAEGEAQAEVAPWQVIGLGVI